MKKILLALLFTLSCRVEGEDFEVYEERCAWPFLMSDLEILEDGCEELEGDSHESVITMLIYGERFCTTGDGVFNWEVWEDVAACTVRLDITLTVVDQVQESIVIGAEAWCFEPENECYSEYRL